MNSIYTPNAGDFLKAEPVTDAQVLTRPSLSYWQDAWIRLGKNKRALASLYLIVGLLLFTLIGPLIWTYDPSLQDLDAISQGPSLGKQALIVENPSSWEGVIVDNTANQSESAPLGATSAIETVGLASTQYVRLRWQAVSGANSYLIYRNDHQPETKEDLGLPLGQNFSGNEVSFEDRLQLKAIDYFYTVIATDGINESAELRTQQVSVISSISELQSQYLGMNAQVGDTVTLNAHPFGTDYLGRDLLARTMYGARVSLFIGIVAPFLFVLLGTLYGGIAGYFAGNIDLYMMRFADFVIALPFLLFMILFKIAFGIGPGESGILPMLIALILLRWPDTARMIRGQVLLIREETYIQASRLLGAKTSYLIFRHMIPNTLGTILVTLTFAIPLAIFTEAFLSFIGMGVAPPTASWGSMCSDGLKTMLSSPHELFFPAFFISLTVLAFNLLGDGLRDAFDSRLRSKE